jgi:AsmA protein
MLKAQELGFGIHLLKLLFKQEVYITKTYLKNAQVFLVKDKYGNANYTILKDSEAFEEPKETSANELNLNFNKLKIKNSSFVYRDEANGITISSIGLKFNAKTALDNGRLELGSVLNVDSLDVMYDKIDYLKGKKFRGTSHIVYDTNNLSIDLDENTVSLNDLDLRFDGNFNLFENGLAYDFIFKCQDKPLSSLLSILPPKYLVWASEMKEVSGRVDAQVTMRGFSGTVPKAFQKDRLALALDLRNTKLAHKESNYMLEDLNLKLKAAQLGNEIDL